MAKKATCPECGYRFQIAGQQIKSLGVRSKKSGRKTFDYEITIPENISEDGRVPTVSNDATLISLFSLYAGVVAAGVTSAYLPNHLPPDTITLICARVGTITMGVSGFIGYGFLCAEGNQRLKRILPWFLEQKEGWAMGKQLADEVGDAVTLTIDTRNEYDGFTSRYFGPLPVSVERFNEWAAAVLNRESMAINKWTGPGKFNRTTEYEPLLAHMRRAGVAVNQPGKGHNLTSPGRRALRQHLKAHSPTAAQERA